MVNNYCHISRPSAYTILASHSAQKMKRFIILISVLSLASLLTFNCSGIDLRLSDSEEELICRFANAEADENAPIAVKLGVIRVALNRLADSGYPDSLAEVIFQPGAFECVGNGRINFSFSHSAVVSARDALRLALLGRDPTEGALNFSPPSDTPPPFKVSFEAGGYLFG